MPKKRPALVRDSLPDGSKIERNYRTGADGHTEPYGSWYWVAYDPDRRPKRKRVNLRTQDRSAAILKAVEYAREYGMGTFDPWQDKAARGGVTVGEAASRFLDAQRKAGKSAATVKSDEGLLDRLGRHLPIGVLLAHVEQRDLEAFVNARKPVPKSKRKRGQKGGERSPATKARILATLRHFFGWAVSEGFLRSSPAEGITIPKQRATRRDHITEAEEEAILLAIAAAEAETEVARDWLKDWIVFGTHTGLRPSEQRLLTWSAVRLAEGMIEVGKDHPVKTPRSRRVVPVAGPALEVLRRRQEAREGSSDGPVFTGAGGERVAPRYLGKALQSFAEQAGVQKRVVPYSLRHAFGTRTAMGGVPLYHIAQMMGTSVAMVEKHYAHYAPSSGARHLNRLFSTDKA